VVYELGAKACPGVLKYVYPVAGSKGVSIPSIAEILLLTPLLLKICKNPPLGLPSSVIQRASPNV
jgi:hypothetical protein